ncbi:transcription termination factor Rho [Rhodococcus pyridinivorans SB3094]|uniref:Transcription termination factor Rho n=2 Tax=Rhodococcus pyridinivorans TaxID=103816 RepID=V9XN93_9NOCA|nr:MULTISPECIES: transcription termination factor Rho [Rhodococcus]AHD23529.1 transcription termination factor Rho [Rhodococcus pyridinivorans SB3094]MCD5418711.1 transcription termination factor Rho [Rhodococcus pyridinivorans]MCT7293341.1 transcription termination factor Rho [Rhodococcus sp. PAE-6]
MVLAELRTLAAELGIKGTSGMRKGDLIAAIKEKQGGGAAAPAEQPAAEKTAAPEKTDAAAKTETAGKPETADKPEGAPSRGTRGRRGRAATDETAAPEQKADAAPAEQKADAEQAEQKADVKHGEESSQEKLQGGQTPSGDNESDGNRRGRGRRGRRGGDNADQNQQTEGADASEDGRQDRDSQRDKVQDRDSHRERGQDRNSGDGSSRRDRNQGDRNQGDRNQDAGDRDGGNQGPRQGQDNRGGDDEEGGRGRRGRRFRERRRGRDRGESGSDSREPEIREDDVLQPVAGILDVLDNYAFVRTSGYLAGPNDVYVSMNMVRKNGLRRGDAITGAVRVPREGEQGNQRQKFNPLVRLDTVNGREVDSAKRRPEFNKLTPLYPNQRLRLETQPNILTTRVIDLVMPIGKGQRALIVSPPKAGKTTVLQDIANAIAVNNPECYLMVVLVDERPEEVTDMQRSVKGEVIASTFDRPPSDHTSVAELAIERAKRLVEMGQDVVVLLDSITRLGRAYNNSSPASGRILSGGVDSTALYPPKRFLGAARNIENGGSLTIIATAMVETGSTGDTVIFEEFKGTGNAELKLDRKIAERRVFPAVDVNPSGTRKDELLMSPDEFAVVHKLRRVLSGLDSHQAIDLLIDRLKKSKTNIEFLMNVAKTAPGALDD